MLCHFHIGSAFLDNDCFHLLGLLADTCNNINYAPCSAVVNKYAIDFIKKKAETKSMKSMKFDY